MAEQRRHQRVRFDGQVLMRIGQGDQVGEGGLENLSLGGLMLRSSLPLRLHESCGVELRLADRTRIDLSVLIVSRIGDLFGARFSPGPLSECLIRRAITLSVDAGRASALSVKVIQGKRLMRVLGNLGAGLRADFLYAINSGVAEIDLAAVTAIDATGVALCRQALAGGRTVIVRASSCVREALDGPESTNP